jgi:hypothetical protein
MPPTNLDDEQTWSLVAFIHSPVGSSLPPHRSR